MSETEKTPAEDKARADIGIVCALPIELGAFMKRCERVKKYSGGRFTFRGGFYDGIRVAVVESGIGYAHARRATQALLEGHHPRWLISSGFCGGLRESMSVGHIVMANSIVDTHGQQLQVDVGVEDNPASGLHVGQVITTDEMVRLVSEKKALADNYQAIAVDMESLAVAQVAKETGTRFLQVRAVSDNLEADLPAEIKTIISDTGSMRLGATLGAIWKRPSSVKDMWRLRENAWQAADQLASFLDGVLVQLYNSAD